MKFSIFIYILISLLLQFNFLYAQQAGAQLYYSTLANKYGFINADGKEIVPVKFDRLGEFSEGIVAVNVGAEGDIYSKEGGKWGYWSADGKELVPPLYEEAKAFKEGLAPVQLEGKYGYINAEGKSIIPFQFEFASPFSEGLAAVKKGAKSGYINKKGELVFEANFHNLYDFQNGYAIVFQKISTEEWEEDGETYFEDIGTYGLIDRNGKLILKAEYDFIHKFQEGFARIVYHDKEGFINLKGEIVIPPIFQTAHDFSEGLAVVGNYILRPSPHDFGFSQEKKDSLEKEVNKLYESLGDDFNAILNHPTFQHYIAAREFEPSERMTYGYIDSTGKIVIDLEFDEAREFIDGKAQIRFGERPMFYILEKDENGNYLPTIEEEMGLGVNLINRKGEILFEENYQMIQRQRDGIIIRSNHKESTVYSKDLKKLFSETEKDINYKGHGFYVLKEGSAEENISSILKNGQLIAKDKNFRTISCLSKNRLLVSYIIQQTEEGYGTKTGIMDEKGKWVLEPSYDFVSEPYSRQ